MKRKLLFAMLCIVSVLGMKAQTWTASEVGEGYYMLYNVGQGQFLTRGNGWGTQASITTSGTTGNGIALRLAGSGSDFKMFTGINGEAKGIENLSGGTVYLDQADNKNSTWTFTQVATDNGPVYTIVSKDNHGGGAGAYLTAGSDGTKVTPGTDGTIDGAKWKLMAIPAQPIGMSDASESNPVDATSLIVNPNFSFDAIKKGDGWTMESSNYNPCGGNVTGDGVVYNPCAESWRAAFALSQALTVPNGIYELTAQAAVTEYTVTGADLPVVYANDVNTPFTAMTEGENSMAGLSASFTAGKYVVGPIRVVVTNGSLTIGVRGTRNDTWCVWDNFKLTYKGVDLSELKAALQAQIDAVPALQGTTTTAAYDAAKNYADGIDMDALTTEEAISTASTELANRVNAAKALQPSYSRYAAIGDAALAISSNVVLPDVESATTTAAIDAAIPTLRENFLTELPNVEIPADPGYIDVTAVMVDNASVRQNTDYWTKEGTPNGNNSFGKCAYNECEFYAANFKFYQTLALSTGTWGFGVTGFHRAGNHSTYFYAGADKILIPGVANNVVNTMAEAQTYFNNGNGKVALKFVIESDQNVEIGIDNQDTETDKWTIFRDFTLKYYGAPDYSVYAEQWDATVEAANEALDAQAYKYISGSERTAVTDAIADAPDGSSKANYLEKIQTLEAATATFKAAAPSYNAWVLAKTETKNLWGSALGVADPTTAAEAVAGVNALNVATAEHVATNYSYSLTSKIGDFSTWTAEATYTDGEGTHNDTPQTLHTEHWSATERDYYEQGVNGWGASNGFSATYTKEATLPAGNYVIKVAARASAAVTGTISADATANTVALPNVGAGSKGIDTSGAANFGEGTFANSNNGFGWQWRFLPFTVANDGTKVTITIQESTTATHNWFSLADAELLSDEDKTTKITLDEASDMASTISSNDGELATVTLNRSIKVGYNTVVLPFDLTAAQVQAVFGAGSTVYSYSENSSDVNSAELSFTKVNAGTITANVPVLVQATSASTSNEIAGVTIESASDAKVEGTNFDYVGVYALTNLAEGDYFLATKEEFQYVFQSDGTDDSAKPFRAYFQKKTAAPVKAVLFIDGVATAIEAIDAQPAEQNGNIFNLAGQRVNKAQRGVYIINGKKVAVK